MNRALAMIVLLLLPVAGACSDDGVSPDTGVDGTLPDAPGVDLAVDAPGDLAVDVAADAAGDSSADDQGADAATDSAADLGPVDGGPDAAAPDLGSPQIWGYVSRSVAPMLDGKGDLYIGLYNPIFPPPAFQVGGTIVKKANLSKVGSKVMYSIHNAQPGKWKIWAFLDDNSNAVAIPWPFSDGFDLVTNIAKPVTVTTGGTTQKIDLVLDKLMGFSDAGVGDGMTLTALKGKISSTAKYLGDGKGNIHVSLHNKVPPAGQINATTINSSDLSSPYAFELYYLVGVTQGNYYLRVFLDDNNNFNFLAPGPDKGDLIHSKPIQVHVVNKVVNVQDVVLDATKP